MNYAEDYNRHLTKNLETKFHYIFECQPFGKCPILYHTEPMEAEYSYYNIHLCG